MLANGSAVGDRFTKISFNVSVVVVGVQVNFSTEGPCVDPPGSTNPVGTQFFIGETVVPFEEVAKAPLAATASELVVEFW